MQAGGVNDIDVASLRDSSMLFPVRTGLGWDKLHPRAMGMRLPDAALQSLAVILAMCEWLGEWPSRIGVVLICLIPKSGGGRRPIGLLPSIVRWWMRARLRIVQAWQASNERAYFYAGASKGATVASWKQAARAELASCLPNVLLHMFGHRVQVGRARLTREFI